MAERTLPPVEQGTVTTKPEEATIIDQTTFQIKGVDTDQVYGVGRSLGEALAMQQQLLGGTPTVAGRPDMFATSPLAGETVSTVTGAGGQQVTPGVATLGQLDQVQAGTLPSFNAETGLKAAETFNQAVTDTVQSAITTQRDTALDADANFDTQLQLQRGALYAALLDETIADEDLKWLTPAQQRAINAGDKDLIRSQIGGINSIHNARQDAAKEAEAKEAADQAAAFSLLNNLMSLGLLGGLSSEEIASMAGSIGVEASALEEMIAEQIESGGLEWQLGTENGNIIAYKFDPVTGAYESKVLKEGAGSGTPPPSSGLATQITYTEWLDIYSQEHSISTDPNSQYLQDEYAKYLTMNALSQMTDSYVLGMVQDNWSDMISQGLVPTSVDDAKYYISQDKDTTTELDKQVQGMTESLSSKEQLEMLSQGVDLSDTQSILDYVKLDSLTETEQMMQELFGFSAEDLGLDATSSE